MGPGAVNTRLRTVKLCGDSPDLALLRHDDCHSCRFGISGGSRAGRGGGPGWPRIVEAGVHVLLTCRVLPSWSVSEQESARLYQTPCEETWRLEAGPGRGGDAAHVKDTVSAPLSWGLATDTPTAHFPGCFKHPHATALRP